MVVGVDGSEQSQRALAWALSYAAKLGIAVQVIMTVPDTSDAEQAAAASSAGEQTLASLVETASSRLEPRPSVSYEVVAGDPAVVLVNASRDAQLIVLGSHSQSKLSNPALGSVSLACIRLGSCPVLVIQAGRPEPPHPETAIEPA